MLESTDVLGRSGSVTRAALQVWATSGRRGVLEVSGKSMRPLLPNGSKVVVEPIKQHVRLGDIVVYCQNGGLIVHRIVRAIRRNQECIFRTKGDSAAGFDTVLLKESDLAAKVVGLVRGQDIVDLESPAWQVIGRALAACSYVLGLVLSPLKRRGKLPVSR